MYLGGLREDGFLPARERQEEKTLRQAQGEVTEYDRVMTIETIENKYEMVANVHTDTERKTDRR